MKRNYIILFSIIFLFGIKGITKEYIAYGEKDKVVIVNFKGKIIKQIKLPQNIRNTFKIKGNIVCFAGKDNRIHLYDWKSGKERMVIKGPYVYDKETIGGKSLKLEKEIYSGVDFDDKSKKIVLAIEPYHMHYGYREIGLIDMVDRKFLKLTDNDSDDCCPVISGNYIVYSSEIDIFLRLINNKNVINLSKKYAHFKNRENKDVNDYLLDFHDNKIIFTEYERVNNKKSHVKKILEYDVKNDKFKIINKDFKFNLSYKNILAGLSGNKRYSLLLLSGDSYGVNDYNFKAFYLLNLKSIKKTLIYKNDSSIISPQFYELSER